MTATNTKRYYHNGIEELDVINFASRGIIRANTTYVVPNITAALTLEYTLNYMPIRWGTFSLL